MNLHEFQKEINNLLLLYYTSIGVIQRDCDNEDIKDTMKILSEDIKQCRKRLKAFLDENEDNVKILENYEDIVMRCKNFIEDGNYIIDKIIEKCQKSSAKQTFE
ncbi:hypothetical protein GINT2_000761 [Glugoides intestinalis]